MLMRINNNAVLVVVLISCCFILLQLQQFSMVNAQTDFSSYCSLTSDDGRTINFGNVSVPTSYRADSYINGSPFSGQYPDIVYFFNICRYATCNTTDKDNGCFGCDLTTMPNTFAIKYNKTAKSCVALTGSNFATSAIFKWSQLSNQTTPSDGFSQAIMGISLTYLGFTPQDSLVRIVGVNIFCNMENYPYFNDPNKRTKGPYILLPETINPINKTAINQFFIASDYACPPYFTRQEVVNFIAPIIVLGCVLIVTAGFIALFVAIQLIVPKL